MIGNMFRKAKTYVYLRAYLRNNLGDDMFVRYIAEKYPDVTFKICTSSKYAQPFVKQTNIKNISRLGFFADRVCNKFIGKQVCRKYIETNETSVFLRILVFYSPKCYNDTNKLGFPITKGG